MQFAAVTVSSFRFSLILGRILGAEIYSREDEETGFIVDSNIFVGVRYWDLNLTPKGWQPCVNFNTDNTNGGSNLFSHLN